MNIANNISEKSYIDPVNRIDREIDGCKVRLFFTQKQNDIAERRILDSLMLVFDRKKQEISNVQTENSHLRQLPLQQVKLQYSCNTALL